MKSSSSTSQRGILFSRCAAIKTSLSRISKDYNYDGLNIKIDDLNIKKVISDHPAFEEHTEDTAEPAQEEGWKVDSNLP